MSEKLYGVFAKNDPDNIVIKKTLPVLESNDQGAKKLGEILIKELVAT